MEQEHKKILIKDIFCDCPMGMALNNCLSRKVRKLPLDKRMKIVDEMEPEELDFLLKNHKECRLSREKLRK
jgi:hypothetical protein